MKNNILDKALAVLQDKLAKEINVIDFKRENPFTDYFVICETTSQRQIDAIVNGFSELNKKSELDIRAIDGKGDSGWVVVDLYDVVVHIFDKTTRAEYELDKLFIKYPQELIIDNV